MSELIFYHTHNVSDQPAAEMLGNSAAPVFPTPDTAGRGSGSRTRRHVNYCGTPLLSITSNINLLACSVFCVYSNTTGLNGTQQHKELTSHDPLMAINAARRRCRWLGTGQSIRCPAEPCPSHSKTPKPYNTRMFPPLLCKQSIYF